MSWEEINYIQTKDPPTNNLRVRDRPGKNMAGRLDYQPYPFCK